MEQTVKKKSLFKDFSLAGEFTPRENAWGMIFIWPAHFYYIPTLLQYAILYYYGINAVKDNYHFLNTLLNFAIGGFSSIVIILTLRKFIALNIQHFKKKWYKDLAWVCTFGYSIIFICTWIGSILQLAFLGDVSAQSGNQQLFETLQSINPSLMFVTTVVFAPIVEEMIFRGLIFTNLAKKNIWIAHIVSAFAFGLLHVYSFILAGDFSQFIYVIPYVTMGFGFSYVYQKRGNIIVPILLHALNNLIAFALSYWV